MESAPIRQEVGRARVDVPRVRVFRTPVAGELRIRRSVQGGVEQCLHAPFVRPVPHLLSDQSYPTPRAEHVERGGG